MTEFKEDWAFIFSPYQGVLADQYVLVRHTGYTEAIEMMNKTFGCMYGSLVRHSQVISWNVDSFKKFKCYAIIEEDGRVWYP